MDTSPDQMGNLSSLRLAHIFAMGGWDYMAALKTYSPIYCVVSLIFCNV